MRSTVSMPPELLVELVQQCVQDLESFLHDRESAVLIVSMVDTAVTIATHLGRGRGGEGRELMGRRRGRERGKEGGEGINERGGTGVRTNKPAVFHVDQPVRQTLPPGDLRPVGGCL